MTHQKPIVSLLLAGLLTLSLTACGKDDSQPSPDAGASVPAGTAVQVETVTSDTISSENKVSGKVTSDLDASVFVATSAKCTAVYVEVGDTVRAGQALCTLDLASTLSSYEAANIGYTSAVQSYQDQAALFDKQIALYEKNVNDLKALTLMSAQVTRDSTLSQLEAGIQSAKASVEQLATALENVDARGNVIAPISGVLLSLSAEKDGFVSSAMPVAVIDGVDQLKIAVTVSEALVPKLSIGDSVDVTVSSVGASFTGTIRAVDKTANAQTKLYTVTVTIPSEVDGLLSGMFADVTFHTDTSADTIVIPAQAVLTSGGTQYVYVVEGDTARYVEVTTGLTGNGVTEITSGLEAGQQLVTVGQAYLSDGAPVRIVTGED